MTRQTKNVLLIVEGEREEPRLVEAIFNSFNPGADYKIYTYRTVIHDLINKIVNDYSGDYENLEICQVLLDMLTEDEAANQRELLLYTRFTDVILMFDFDPHDNRLSLPELRKMQIACSDSTNTGTGLLLINYPAVEAVKEAAGLPYEKFADSFVEASETSSYKAIADARVAAYKAGNATNFSNFGSMLLIQAIANTAGKIQHLVYDKPIDDTFPFTGAGSLSELCLSLRGSDVLDYQTSQLSDMNRVATCGMGPFFIALWSKALDGAWRSYYGR